VVRRTRLWGGRSTIGINATESFTAHQGPGKLDG
jgi:hypothetical protein